MTSHYHLAKLQLQWILPRYTIGLRKLASSVSATVYSLLINVLDSIKELRGGHFKLNFSDLSQTIKVDGLMFSPSDRLKKNLSLGAKYQILSELQWNYFNGRKTIQLLIRDLKPMSTVYEQ